MNELCTRTSFIPQEADFITDSDFHYDQGEQGPRRIGGLKFAH